MTSEHEISVDGMIKISAFEVKLSIAKLSINVSRDFPVIFDDIVNFLVYQCKSIYCANKSQQTRNFVSNFQVTFWG